MEQRVFKVLIVEDEPVAEKLSADLLKHFSCKVDTARTASQALRKATREYYNLIFMDLGLEKMDGFELTQHIRSTCPKNHSTPIVALTKYKGKEVEQKCKDFSMNGYLIKPFTFEKCCRIVDQFLAGGLWLT